MGVDFGLLAVLLIVAVVTLFATAFMIGVVLRWLADWRRIRSRTQAPNSSAQATIERARQ
jgi:hypothetical protein